MAVQTVDLANIDAVIKDGVNLSEIVLDGAYIWTAPPTVYELNLSYATEFTATQDPVFISALSGDGLVYAAHDRGGPGITPTIYVYSRTSTATTNFTLLDSVGATNNIQDLNLSDDGSVMQWTSASGTLGGSQIAVDDGGGSYSINKTFPSAKRARLSSDGFATAMFNKITDTYLSIDVYFNIGTKASPDWVEVFTTTSSASMVESIAISRWTPNGVTVLVGSKNGFSKITRYVMDSNFYWTEDAYVPSDYYTAVGIELAISDDGKTIASKGERPDYYVFSIITIDQVSNTFSLRLSTIDGTDTYKYVAVSGDGTKAGYSSELSYPARVYYSKINQFDSFSDIYVDNTIKFSYDGFVVSCGPHVLENNPIFLLSTNRPFNFVSEGQSINISLDSFNVASGTSVDYTISGIQAADLLEPLTGSFTILNNGADQVFNVTEDLLTEGTQTATITLDNYPTVSLSFSILDTSTTP